MTKPVHILIAMSMVVASAAARAESTEVSRLKDEGLAIWKQGKALYDANKFREAIDYFERSRVKYEMARSAHDVTLCERAIHAAACLDRKRSDDVDQLKELVGENEDKVSRWMSPYPKSCLGFPAVAEEVRARILALQK